MRFTREITDLPARKKLIETQLDAHKKALEASDDVLRKNGLRQKELEAEVEEKRARIRKLREQQLAVKKNDEYRAIEKEIFAFNQEIAKIEDAQIAVMEQIETAQKIKAEKTGSLKEEQALVNGELERLEQRVGSIQTDLDETQRERDELAKDVDEVWLSRYERVLKHRGDFAVVPVENGACGGCHMKLPPQVVYDVRRLDEMTTCLYCGRMLYYMP